MTASTERASPLGAEAGWLTAASASPAHFALRELPFVAQINLRGEPDDAFKAAVRDATGLTLPEQAGAWSGDAARCAIWLGPDEWLITGGDGEHAPIESALRTALRGRHHSVVDVSASRTVLALSGRDARPVLARGCTLDVSTRAFSPPATAQTLLAKSQVILQCIATERESAFRLYVRNSFAEYLARWLVDAAGEAAASRALDGERLADRFLRG
ncbi:MAG TPA: sarcosine oxidase subunit gamma family protein [Burkholderiaceae bacterium]|nr:sarcosine oxidase subunit gamma family protein [Burkholderiaceae bacterium]